MSCEFALSVATLRAGVKLAAKPLGSTPGIEDAMSSNEVPHGETTKVEVPIVQTKARWGRASKARGWVRQAGAVCLRKRAVEGTIEILLIRSLRNGLWGIPKGHIEPGETSYETVLREAFEETGIRGETTTEAIDSFTYSKGGQSLYHVAVHLTYVKDVEEDFPERQIRQAEWVPLRTASRYVGQAGLTRILCDLALTLTSEATLGKHSIADRALGDVYANC